MKKLLTLLITSLSIPSAFAQGNQKNTFAALNLANEFTAANKFDITVTLPYMNVAGCVHNDINGVLTTGTCGNTAGVTTLAATAPVAVSGSTGAVTVSIPGITAIQGNGSKLLASSTVSGGAGTGLCIDASGNATTSGCSFATGTVNAGTAGQIGYYATTSSAISGDTHLTDVAGLLTYSGSAGVAITSTFAGFTGLGQGTAQSVTANTVGLTAGTSVTGYNLVFPSAASTGILSWTNVSNIVTGSFVTGFTGSKVAGACTFTITSGIVTNVTGC